MIKQERVQITERSVVQKTEHVEQTAEERVQITEKTVHTTTNYQVQ